MARVDLDKLPPSDTRLEQLVLYTLLNDPFYFIYILQNLKADDFFKPEHKDLFSIVSDMYKRDGVVLNSYLIMSEMIKKGMDYSIIMSLNTVDRPQANNVQLAVKLIKDFSAARTVLSISTQTIERIHQGEDWYEVCTKNVRKLEEIAEDYSSKGNRFSINIETAFDEIKSIMENKRPRGLELKFKKLKAILDLAPDNLIFLAASPKAGKTRLLVALFYQIFTLNEDVAVLWFSGEDSTAKIIRLLISVHTGIPEEVMLGKSRFLYGEELDQMNAAKDYIKPFDLDVIDEPTHVDEVYMRFSSFCAKRKDKLCILIYDNFNIARDLMHDITAGLEKENAVSSAFQRINTMNNKNGKRSLTIVIDHLSKEYLKKQSFEEGYRPRLEHLKGSNRKYEVVTQLAFLNRPARYKQLMGDERGNPSIKVDGQTYSREEILENLLIFELVANRNGSILENKTLIRFTASMENMQFTEWTDAAVSSDEFDEYEERNITDLSSEQFVAEFYSKFPSGDRDKCYLGVKYELGKEDAFGNLITLDYLINKYTKYYNVKKELFNGKFTRKENVIVDIWDFCQKKMYDQNFDTVSTKKEETRDFYLYGLT